MQVLIVGPGAVGGVLAASLRAAKHEVILLDRTPAPEDLVFQPLSGPKRRLHVQRARARAAHPVDCVLLCVKHADVPAALREAKPWTGPSTAVVALQNGLGHEKLIRKAYGPARSVIGTAYFAADRPAPGVFAHTGGRNVLLGASPSNAAALSTAAKLLRSGGWEVGVKKSEERLLWTKLCFNAAVNGLGALCARPNGALAKEPALQDLLRAVISEASRVARAAGHPPLYRHMEALVVRGCRNAPDQRNSMLQDLQAGRRTERAAIFGPLLSAAKRTKTPAPMLGAISASLERLERLRP